MSTKLLLSCITAALLTLFIVNTVIFGIGLYNTDTGADWSVALKHFTYSINGENVGLGLDTMGAYAILAIGFVSRYFQQKR